MALCGAQHGDWADSFLERAGQRPVQCGGVATPRGVYRVLQLVGRRFPDHGPAILERHLAGAGTIKPEFFHFPKGYAPVRAKRPRKPRQRIGTGTKPMPTEPIFNHALKPRPLVQITSDGGAMGGSFEQDA